MSSNNRPIPSATNMNARDDGTYLSEATASTRTGMAPFVRDDAGMDHHGSYLPQATTSTRMMTPIRSPASSLDRTNAFEEGIKDDRYNEDRGMFCEDDHQESTHEIDCDLVARVSASNAAISHPYESSFLACGYSGDQDTENGSYDYGEIESFIIAENDRLNSQVDEFLDSCHPLGDDDIANLLFATIQ